MSIVKIGMALIVTAASTGCIFTHPHNSQQATMDKYNQLNAKSVETQRQNRLAEPEHDAANVPPNWNRDFREAYRVAIEASPSFIQPQYTTETREILKAYVTSPGWVYDRDPNGQVKQRMFAMQVFYKITNGELVGRCYSVQANVRQDKTLGTARHFEPPQMDLLGSAPPIRVSCAAVASLPG